MPSDSKLMDTEIGGEQTQYEGTQTFVKPHAKEAGTLGDPSTSTTSPTTQPPSTSKSAPNTQGITPAEKIRFGQSISESGMGGQTTSSTGEARTEGGFGGTEALGDEGEREGGKDRGVQGYGGEGEVSGGVRGDIGG